MSPAIYPTSLIFRFALPLSELAHLSSRLIPISQGGLYAGGGGGCLTEAQDEGIDEAAAGGGANEPRKVARSLMKSQVLEAAV